MYVQLLKHLTAFLRNYDCKVNLLQLPPRTDTKEKESKNTLTVRISHFTFNLCVGVCVCASFLMKPIKINMKFKYFMFII